MRVNIYIYHCSYYPNTTLWNNWTFTCVLRITLRILFHLTKPLLEVCKLQLQASHAIIKKKQRNAKKTTTKQNQDKRIWAEKQHTFAAEGFFIHLRCWWGWSSACIHTTTTVESFRFRTWNVFSSHLHWEAGRKFVCFWHLVKMFDCCEFAFCTCSVRCWEENQ